MTDIIYKDEVYNIIGAAFQVYNELGAGFLESVYEEALTIELEENSIPYKTQVKLPVYYKGRLLQKEFFADLIIYDKIIVELKCVEKITTANEAQLLNYLKAINLKLGLLINFGNPEKLEWKRLIHT